jgi:secreted trypsin-like serine protease
MDAVGPARGSQSDANPLVANVDGKPLQLGIVSWGEGPADSEVNCGHQDVYGVYSRVSSFKDWIEARVKTAN